MSTRIGNEEEKNKFVEWLKYKEEFDEIPSCGEYEVNRLVRNDDNMLGSDMVLIYVTKRKKYTTFGLGSLLLGEYWARNL